MCLNVHYASARPGPAADPGRPRVDGTRPTVGDAGDRHLPEFAVVAPDLLGHGRSSWDAPWTIDANVAALADAARRRRGSARWSSSGIRSAVRSRWASRRRGPISSRRWCCSIPRSASTARGCARSPTQMLASPDYPDRDEARAEKASRIVGRGATDRTNWSANSTNTWSPSPNGRVGWRIGSPGDDVVLERTGPADRGAAPGTPTTLIRATRTQPPYVSDELVTALRERLGSDFIAARLRLRSHGGAGQARGDGGGDPGR